MSNVGKDFQPQKRTRSFWEPIYNPSDVIQMTPSDWDFSTSTGVKNSVFHADNLRGISVNRPQKFDNMTFTNCDFRGAFNFSDITFSGCNFKLCDFGRSYWERVKFTNCYFSSTSLSLAEFDHCQFIDCKWERIGFSGNETRFFSTWVTNPDEFVRSGYTNTDKDVLSQKGTNKNYQLMRLERTKARIAKIMLANQVRLHDDASYYCAIKTYINQSLDARIGECFYNIFSAKQKILRSGVMAGVLWLEKAILNAAGKLNNWGHSIARPTILGVAAIFLFAAIYYLSGVSPTFGKALMVSFDITLVAGYTKHSIVSAARVEQILYAFNLFIGLWWYAVLVPTVINRISRVR